MAAAGMSTVGRIRPAYVADTHALSQEGGAFKLRAMALPALNASLSSHSRKPRQRSLWTGDARVRRITRPLGTSSGRMVSVSCSINGPGDTSSSSSSPSVPEGDLPLRDGDGDDFASGSAAIWDLRLLQAVAARIGDPLRDILSSASRRLQTYFDSYRKPKPDQEDEAEPEKPAVQKEEWDWERWREHFVHMEEQEKRASILKFHLEGAVRDEDFREAARLKCALRAATANDPVSEVLAELKKALEEESYEYATRLRDEAAAGLVGWWVGLAEGENDPYGRIINISSSYGRFIAKGYTARQLASASAGTSLFEVFIRKDPEGYHQQAVYLQRGGIGDSAPGTSSSSIDVNIDVNIVDMNALTEDGKEIKAKDLAEAFGDEKEKSGDASVSDDGLSSIINFLKDRIPDVKLKVFRVIAQNGEDIPKIVEQILEEVETQEGEGAKGHKEIEGPTEEVLQEAKDKAGENSELVQEVHKEIPVRLIVGGMLQNATEDKLPKAPTRIRARIETQSRDSFLFHIEEIAAQQSPAKESVPSLKVATFMTQASADVPPEIAKVVSNLEKIPVKVSKDMGEFLKLAVSQVQRRRGLSKCTSFERIKLTGPNTDPLAGLYIGAFGPYTSELVQLRQKYGHWHGESDISNFKNNLEFFEYVEAVKLTGDLNVPAGQVTFRAKIGKDSRLSHRGFYPEELGVIARYKGQGRLAEPGFKNPQWVDGELLLLDGKGFGHLNGAELGFIYSVPERHFLVLFNRLKLQVE